MGPHRPHTAAAAQEVTTAGPRDVSATVSFVRAVREGESTPCTLADSLQNAKLMDACYRQAGLQPRGLHPSVIRES